MRLVRWIPKALLTTSLLFASAGISTANEIVQDFTGSVDPADCNPICWHPIDCCPGIYTPTDAGLEIRSTGGFDILLVSGDEFSGDVRVRSRASFNGTVASPNGTFWPGPSVGAHYLPDNSAYYGGVGLNNMMQLTKFVSGAPGADIERPFDTSVLNDVFNVEVSVNGDQVELRIWNDGEDRPDDALLIMVDSELRHGAAFFGGYVTSGNPLLIETVTILSPPFGPSRARFHRGDANVNGQIDISDPITILGNLFLGEPGSLSCREAADPNNDGVIDISDGVYLLSWLFIAGPEPAAPGPTSSPCGPDPDPPGSKGDLGCESYPSC